ncbi:hypothetical protein BGX26_012236 [Mortierella sp. AD094]|nr:hypothetical protein BGX26_012236 [Mortierella sp. AD094]
MSKDGSRGYSHKRAKTSRSLSSRHKRPKPQKLPNECFIFIIKHLSHNGKALRNLLVVNKFFFNLTIPYLMNYNGPHGFLGDIAGKKRLALAITSLLEARMRTQPDAIKDSQHAEKTVDAILKPFGLKLAGPFITPGFQMLRELYNRLDHKDEISVDTSHSNRNDREAGRGLTVDYSKYFSEMESGCWTYMSFSKVIMLRKLPERMRNGYNYEYFNPFMLLGPPITSGVGAMSSVAVEVGSDGEDEVHTIKEQESSIYITQIRKALLKLFFYYNHDCITSFTFDLSVADSYLPFATKMRKLQALRFPKPRSIVSDNLTKSAVLFIKQNQETFSRKSQLEVEFESGWFMDSDDYPLEDDFNEADLFLMDAETYNVRMRNRRLHAINFMKPMVSILEAVGLPSSMSVEEVPLFYERAHAIGTDRLRDFTDTDQSRFEQGEGPAMEAFLKRCENLETLNLGVGSAEMLSWAADKALGNRGLTRGALPGFVSNSDLCSESEQETKSSTDPRSLEKEIGSEHRDDQQQQQQHANTSRHSTNLLNSLKSLKLYSTHSYRSAIHTMNDAMVAFAGSIQEIELIGHYLEEDHWTLFSSSLVKEWDRNSFRLRNNPWANQVGEWPLLLPQLRKICITLHDVACIQVGSFSQCPNLEVIEMKFGKLDPSDRDVDEYGESYDIEPDPKPDDDVIQADLDDDDSFTESQWFQADVDRTLFPTWNLPKLEVLRLEGLAAARFDFASLSSMKRLEYLELNAAKRSTKRGTERHDLHQYKEHQQLIWRKRLSRQNPSNRGIRGGRNRSSNTGTVRWPLPAIKEMTLRGPPASMFHLDWLKECPNLVVLKLDSDDDVLDISRNAFFAADLNEDQNRGGKGNSVGHPCPFLMKVLFYGKWTISEQILRHLLAVHAPLLVELYLGHDPSNLSSFQLFKTIHDIYDSKHSPRGTTGLLMSTVTSSCALDETETEKLGLMKLTKEMLIYEEKLRVYETQSGRFVRREEYERVLGGNLADSGNSDDGALMGLSLLIARKIINNAMTGALV